MIPVLIFFAHVVFLTYVFAKNYVDENFTSALLSSIFVVILFSVGWTVSEFLLGLFMESEGLSLLFPRAAFSLLLLTIIEVFFYRYYFSAKSRKVQKAAA